MPHAGARHRRARRGVLTVAALRRIVIDATQRRAVRLDELAGICARLPRGVGRTRLREVVAELARSPGDSPFEWEVVAAVTERGLQPVTGFPWRCPDGRVIHLHLALPDVWVAVRVRRPRQVRHRQQLHDRPHPLVAGQHTARPAVTW